MPDDVFSLLTAAIEQLPANEHPSREAVGYERCNQSQDAIAVK